MDKHAIRYILVEMLAFTTLPVITMVGYIDIVLSKTIMVILLLIFFFLIYKLFTCRKKNNTFQTVSLIVVCIVWHVFIGLPFLLHTFKWCPSCP